MLESFKIDYEIISIIYLFIHLKSKCIDHFEKSIHIHKKLLHISQILFFFGKKMTQSCHIMREWNHHI
jgi:hypothetical protein